MRSAQSVAERGAPAKTPRLQTTSSVRLTATASGISVDEAAIIAAEAAAAAEAPAVNDKTLAALARVFPKVCLHQRPSL